MNRSKVSWRWILYELRNVTGNPFVHVFGVLFPSLITILIAKSAEAEIPNPVLLKQMVTSVFLGNGAIIPMATILMGYSCTYSQELEKKIPERMQLFGCSQRCTICNRLIAETIFLTFAYGVYFVINLNVLKLAKPIMSGVVLYFVVCYIFAVILFLMSHAIAGLTKKFGLTFFISMSLYFGIMILSGMMGIEKKQLPKGVQVISNLLPTTYMKEGFYEIWVGNSYRLVSMIQAFLFIGAISGILMLTLVYQNRRNLH